MDEQEKKHNEKLNVSADKKQDKLEKELARARREIQFYKDRQKG